MSKKYKSAANQRFADLLSKHFPGLVGDGSGLIGSDIDLETSAFEYGILGVTNRPDGKLRILYSGDFKNFDWADFDKNTDVRKEFNWVNWEKFFSFLGIDAIFFHTPENAAKEQERYFRETHLFDKIRDLINCYGADNICGTPSNPVNFREIFE